MAEQNTSVRIIKKVVVGSRLHGLETPTSDWDYRGVHISPLKDVLSPFCKLKDTTWIEGDEDNTSYELSRLCKDATKGNATSLEVFFSDKVIESSIIADEMEVNWIKFMNTKQFIAASRGYAHNQWNKFYNFESAGIKNQERTAKFAVAFLRVMWQCEQFLLTGKFKCSLKESDMYDLMKKIKPMNREEIQGVLPEIVEAMSQMDMRVAKAEGDASEEILNLKPDLEWIEDFIYRAYMASNFEEPQDPYKLYEEGKISATELHKIIKKNA